MSILSFLIAKPHSGFSLFQQISHNNEEKRKKGPAWWRFRWPTLTNEVPHGINEWSTIKARVFPSIISQPSVLIVRFTQLFRKKRHSWLAFFEAKLKPTFTKSMIWLQVFPSDQFPVCFGFLKNLFGHYKIIQITDKVLCALCNHGILPNTYACIAGVKKSMHLWGCVSARDRAREFVDPHQKKPRSNGEWKTKRGLFYSPPPTPRVVRWIFYNNFFI